VTGVHTCALPISHRLSTVMSADQIIVLENGLIRERGKHEDLVRAGGLYSELFARQDLTTSN
jgi:ATP-binding cassette subfamily B protein